jgi:sec-independent protein translocase protein TatB
MFGMSMTEVIIIFVVALLILGPNELPKAARTFGKTLRDVRRATDDLRETFDREVMQERPTPRPQPAEGQVAALAPTLVPPPPSLPDAPPPAETEVVPGTSASAGPAVTPAPSPAASMAPPAPAAPPEPEPEPALLPGFSVGPDPFAALDDTSSKGRA